MKVFPTMITPFLSNGEVDYETAKKYVDYYFDSGCDGIFAVCQSSEIFFLSEEERVKLNKVVYARAQELKAKSGRDFEIISSGHTSDSIEDQARELCAIYESGTDALILITNRLDINNEGDDVFIKNAEKLLSMLPKEAKLGFYECPYPYKRLVTPKILEWCKSTGRFYYMKDTCCDVEMIRERVNVLRGSEFKLYNANCQTLFESLDAGAMGYCGIMANFHPRLYCELCHRYEKDRKTAELIQALVGNLGFTEMGLPYPLSAKYSMTLSGIPTENVARCRPAEDLTDYARSCIKQMKAAADHFEKTVL